jgi:DNA-binding PadR family transcriptional regulator
MLRVGSETFQTLKRISEKPLWANESAASNFYRLHSSGLITRERMQHKGGFMNQFSISKKGQQELDEIQTRERVKAFEERFFCF